MTTYILALNILLQVADGFLTWACLQRENKMEANPILRWLFGKVGIVGGLLLVKSIGTLVCIGAYFTGPYATPALMIIAMIYVVVVGNNLRHLKGD